MSQGIHTPLETEGGHPGAYLQKGFEHPYGIFRAFEKKKGYPKNPPKALTELLVFDLIPAP